MTLNGRAFDSFDEWWFVCQTKPMSGNEKALARDLTRIGTAYFLPLEKHGDKSRTVYRPLFPGYLFAGGTDGDRYDVKATGRVVQIIDASGTLKQAQLRDQLLYIYEGLIAGRTFTPPVITVDLKVEISSNFHIKGFRGFSGVVAEIRDNGRCTVVVELFGRQIPLDVPQDDVEPT